jgi:catechol 2,3-dioxygenase-like lactoylglutathione lyase family enzyme
MKNIEIIMIPTPDLASPEAATRTQGRHAAKEFYKKLGLVVVTETTDAHGDPWIQMGFPGQDTTISLAGFHAIICETDSIEKDIDELKKKGIEVGKIDNTPWGRFAWTKDPAGNGICLHEKPKE